MFIKSPHDRLLGSSIQIEVIKPNGASIFSILYFSSVGRIFYQYQLMAAIGDYASRCRYDVDTLPVDLSKQIYEAADDEIAVESMSTGEKDCLDSFFSDPLQIDGPDYTTRNRSTRV